MVVDLALQNVSRFVALILCGKHANLTLAVLLILY